MTSDACHKGLPKSPTGEIPQFKGTSAPGHRQALHWECVHCAPSALDAHECLITHPVPAARVAWRGVIYCQPLVGLLVVSQRGSACVQRCARGASIGRRFWEVLA